MVRAGGVKRPYPLCNAFLLAKYLNGDETVVTVNARPLAVDSGSCFSTAQLVHERFGQLILLFY